METAVIANNRSDNIRSYYEKHGYVICRGLIDDAVVDGVIEAYDKYILPSDKKFFRQNENKYSRNRLTPHGFVEQSFLDPHNYKRFPQFRESLMNLYFGEPMRNTLTGISGSNEHNLMQSMFFDANAETPPHQDWWYLDTVPLGHLLGSWIALEDIKEDAGRFFVLPGTHERHLHQTGMPHSEWMRLIAQYVADHPHEVHAPALKKGDVLFWNSRLIHGSLETRNPVFSRKSLTAHYIPSEMAFGNLFISKPWVQYENYGPYRYFANQPEYSRKAELTSMMKLALYDHPRLLKFARRFQRRSLAGI